MYGLAVLWEWLPLYTNNDPTTSSAWFIQNQLTVKKNLQGRRTFCADMQALSPQYHWNMQLFKRDLSTSFL